MICTTKYIYLKDYESDIGPYQKANMSSFLQSMVGDDDLTGYELPSDLSSKATTYNKLIGLILGRYWEKPIGKAYIPSFIHDETIDETTLEKVWASFSRRFITILNRTHERYITLIDAYEGERTHLLDQVGSNTTSKRKHNDTPQNPNTADVYEGDDYITDFTKFETENKTDFATKMQRLNELNQLYEDKFDEWVNEFHRAFLEEQPLW